MSWGMYLLTLFLCYVVHLFVQHFNRWGTGAAGPAFFGLGVKQSLVILLAVDLMYVSRVGSTSTSLKSQPIVT